MVLCNVLLFFAALATLATVARVESAAAHSVWPIIMAHDAATGYLEGTDFITQWAKTQSTDMVGQLQCGARALDVRPLLLRNGTLVMHHGFVDVPQKLEDGVREVQRWSRRHRTELVLLYFSKCLNDGCERKVQHLMAKMRIHKFQSREAQTRGLFYLDAKSVTEHYDKTIECCIDVEDGPERSVCCDHSDKPMQRMREYFDWCASADDKDLFKMVQGHWQTSMWSIVHGILRKSSVLLDEERAHVNRRIAEMIRAERPKWSKNAAFIEIDNVCDGGHSIASALHDENAKA